MNSLMNSWNKSKLSRDSSNGITGRLGSVLCLRCFSPRIRNLFVVVVALSTLFFLMNSPITNQGDTMFSTFFKSSVGLDHPEYISVCGPVKRSIARMYTDLVSYPLRTPDLAIDGLIIRERSASSSTSTTSGADGSDGTTTSPLGLFDVILCNRSRPPPLLAIPGGYVEVGEAAERGFVREVFEETHVDLVAWLRQDEQRARGDGGSMAEASQAAEAAINKLKRASGRVTPVKPQDNIFVSYFGLYTNPIRDKRRHTASAVYTVFVPPQVPFNAFQPRAKDDVKHCQWWPVEHILKAERRAVTVEGGGRSLFAFDHGSLLSDVVEALRDEVSSR